MFARKISPITTSPQDAANEKSGWLRICGGSQNSIMSPAGFRQIGSRQNGSSILEVIVSGVL